MSPNTGGAGASQSPASFYPGVSNQGSPTWSPSPLPGLPLSFPCARFLFLSGVHQSGMTQPLGECVLSTSWEVIAERHAWLARSSRPCSPERWASGTPCCSPSWDNRFCCLIELAVLVYPLGPQSTRGMNLACHPVLLEAAVTVSTVSLGEVTAESNCPCVHACDRVRGSARACLSWIPVIYYVRLTTLV